ncbi:uncharacterized protein LOC129178287 isoform X3 [Dunckerocampus dactyliophorus]|uniref:uncharacterized protein LOC129178287 isoform X3 n=1 Tax=Dunckerocampus dactyliophorus TaxID=161453 RepID=UPI0024056380|nr:uncharacterized protein LOC129178287 isoform X3 [Dunckerocampus dactyliophorus]
MCKVQMLRALVNQRLTVAVEEMFVVLERTIAEYEEELSRTKEENERQRQLLDAVFKKHQVVLHRADEDSIGEEEKHRISQEGDHLEGLEQFPVIGVPLKSEDDEDKDERAGAPPFPL